jgi:hypothetical protein
MVCHYFYVSLQLVVSIWLKICFDIHKGYWSAMFFLVISLSCFDIMIILAHRISWDMCPLWAWPWLLEVVKMQIKSIHLA